MGSVLEAQSVPKKNPPASPTQKAGILVDCSAQMKGSRHETLVTEELRILKDGGDGVS